MPPTRPRPRTLRRMLGRTLNRSLRLALGALGVTLGLGLLGSADARTIKIVTADRLELRKVTGDLQPDGSRAEDQEIVVISGSKVELHIDQDVSPANESTGVSLTPTFQISSNQLAIGADGAGYNLQLRDTFNLSGSNLPGNAANALIRVEEGTGDTGNKVSAGNALVFISSGTLIGRPASAGSILTDTAGVYVPAKPNLAPIDAAAHTVSLPLNVFGAPLQPQRPYQWQMYSGIAYKYAPSEGNRVSAYSVYTWPDSTVGPIPATRAVNQNYDFITGAQ